MSLTPGSKPKWELLELQNNPEHILFDSVTSEFNDISGWAVEYWSLKLEEENTDYLYGENPNAKWNGPFRTKMVFDSSEESQVLDVFGLSSDDTIQYMTCTKTIFNRDINLEPKAGDLIKTLYNNKTYEISDVGSEEHIFQGKKLIWEFICRPFRYGNQSESANEFLFTTPSSGDFPDINMTVDTIENDFVEADVDLFSTKTLNSSGELISPSGIDGYEISVYSDNKKIEDESNKIINDVDSTIYGF